MTGVPRDSERTVELDTVFDVLRDSRRRYVLYVLQEADESDVPFEAVVEGVRRYEAGDGVGAELPPRQFVRTDLVHVHLPKLESVGVLDRDPRTGVVQFHGDPLLEEWAERTREFELR